LKIHPNELGKYLSDEYDDSQSIEIRMMAKKKIHLERTDREFVKPTINRAKPSKDLPTKQR
jgi:hypothetical protein